MINHFLRKKLSFFLNAYPELLKSAGQFLDVEITGIQFDSRKIKAGNLFVAMPGGSVDGHAYIPAAISNGAVAVIGTQKKPEISVPYFQIADAREALAYVSAVFYDYPARKLTVIGVTGTDGKTTTCNLIYQILKKAGLKAGLISTVNAVIGDEVIDTGFHVTTPEPTEIQFYMAKMVEAGLTHVVLEATSHGLAQHRVTGCEFDIAVVTNITHEHLDYHGTYEAYREAKATLFSFLETTSIKDAGNPRLAVLNADDDESYDYLNSKITGNKYSYSIFGNGHLNARNIHQSATGVSFNAEVGEISIPVKCNLPGDYNVSNCLAAFAATVEGLHIDQTIAAQGIESLEGVPGRMERINLGQSFETIVDFAHTPNALKRALMSARQMTKGSVIAIFGSAGLRDRQKRRMMAEVSIGLADLTILTAEDPRTEKLDDILAEMADAASKVGGVEGKTFFRVPDRGEAIHLGVKLAQPGDLVISCGKGHEQSMCFETVEYPWDDRTAMKAALAELLRVEGPQMPLLPTSNKN
jgi:UDP-N-acetylmuramoyl-L-alanyl-D-glutamate--2,6-diaminopimelate ligase